MRKSLFAIGFFGILGGAACGVDSPVEEGPSGDDPGIDTGDEQDYTASFKPGCDKPKADAYALGGTILTPSGPQAGYVVVQDEKIVSVGGASSVPKGIPTIETAGIISPGFMDLHNHVAYNFLPLWESGKRWSNRYQWSKDKGYGPAVKTPYNAVKNAKHMCEAVKYGEFRGIVGGTTTIQGSADIACTRSWVRNVEFTNFCEDHIRQNVLPINTIDAQDAANLNKQFESGQTKAFLVHLAEGIDDKSRAEFDLLRTLGLLKPQVVGIHSTALSEAQLNEMGKAGMKIVWSPLSNLLLYGQTTNIPAAIKAGIKVALAPDWAPSGSSNVLGEMKVADRVNKERFAGFLTDKQIWEMTTVNPAAIAAMDDKLGKIAPGYFADLVVIRGNSSKPYRSIIDANPEDVLLTTVSGQAFYGAEAIVKAIPSNRSYITVDACGESRSLSVTEGDSRIPSGGQSLDAIKEIFAKDGVSSVIPLFQCTSAPESAFK